MKKLILIFILFSFSAFSQQKKDTLKVKKPKMVKKNSFIYYYKGNYWKNTYWLEGNGKDTNNDGKVDYHTTICRLEKNQPVI